MTKDRYLSIKSSVNGFSFANLGIFKGFMDGILGAVWALVLLEIFNGNSAAVGLYSSVYYAFFMMITLMAGEMLKLSSKSGLFYYSTMAIAIMYFMMGFSVRPETFIALDFLSAIPQMLTGTLIALFMADFSDKHGIERLNGRYYFWINAGGLIAPVLAMFIAGRFGIRAPFFAIAVINLLCLFYFKWFGIIQPDKKTKKISAKKTFKGVWRTTVSYFRRRDLVNAYMINCGQYAIYALRVLYVPIMVIESGFSTDVLGWVLTAGIIPYVLLSNLVPRWAKKTGIKFWVALGFLSFAAFSVLATIASGWWLLGIFVLWQFSGAFIEPLTDLFFFNSARGTQRDRFYGIFKTTSRLPRFIVPIFAAGIITLFGATSSVWILTAIVGVLSGVFVLMTKSK